jgi:hypothetical protein
MPCHIPSDVMETDEDVAVDTASMDAAAVHANAMTLFLILTHILKWMQFTFLWETQ